MQRSSTILLLPILALALRVDRNATIVEKNKSMKLAASMLEVNKSMPTVQHVGNTSIELPEDMTTVKHEKIPGNGYKKGSPLYVKQQNIHASADTTFPEGESPFERWKTSMTKELPYTLGSIGIYAILVLVVAYLYHGSKYGGEPLRHLPQGRDPPTGPEWMSCGFTHSCFDLKNLKDDLPLCLMSCCCPLIRWADTISKAAQSPMNFWPALLCLLGLVCLSPLTFGLTSIILVALWLLWRARLREIYKHTHHKTRAALEDIMLLCCCGGMFNCCLLAQEAREVEYTCPGGEPKVKGGLVKQSSSTSSVAEIPKSGIMSHFRPSLK